MMIKIRPIATGHLLLRFSNIQPISSKPNVGTMNRHIINHMNNMVTPDVFRVA